MHKWEGLIDWKSVENTKWACLCLHNYMCVCVCIYRTLTALVYTKWRLDNNVGYEMGAEECVCGKYVCGCG